MGNQNSSSEYVKVLFCGRGCFDTAVDYTKKLLNDTDFAEKMVVKTCNPENIIDEIPTAHIVVPLMCKITRDLIVKAPFLALIHQFGVGVEGIDIEAASECGISVANIPSEGTGNAESCAELAIYLIIACLRNQKALENSIKTKHLGHPAGRTILGANVFIFGMGGIGRQVAARLRAFQPARLVGVSKSGNNSGVAGELVDEIGGPADIPRLAKGCHIVIICVNQDNTTKGIVNKDFIDLLAKGAVIVNVARGGILNYSDVLDAIHCNQLSAVGLDVFHTEPVPTDDPLVNHPRCIVTPHVAGVTHVSYHVLASYLVDNIERLLKGNKLRNVVNEKLLNDGVGTISSITSTSTSTLTASVTTNGTSSSSPPPVQMQSP